MSSQPVRYFTDSGVIGTKEFVARCAVLFERHFACCHPKKPRPMICGDLAQAERREW